MQVNNTIFIILDRFTQEHDKNVLQKAENTNGPWK